MASRRGASGSQMRRCEGEHSLPWKNESTVALLGLSRRLPPLLLTICQFILATDGLIGLNVQVDVEEWQSR